ncbi:MAG: F0F1 ATP synthase subunit delta [Candidatus Omnitrophota bacterium]|nr:F0F1 ATP synthase subunit delta [Candidatus Omnitrophota bacterium]MBU1928710.1 F0F1 ATP synthase subunit delta [Candidatus Omnitrophota bacterium]MBU2034165.1 F0F1 ATP synthase subunit delta [Candidatus Omnitrophota bacterium]MBU2221306.1 F0F1 ATP synthase subunit delta [Candidatus Omnitrophota bacterium]MBU2258301.1 F0F1 ATP synthase subunit delta [Candidatus Omnitrophota bacterium]
MLIVSLVIFQIIIFITLTVVLRKLLGRNVTSATAHLDYLSAEFARKEKEVKAQYDEAKRQSQEILANALKDADSQRENILKEVQKEKERIISESQNKADEIVKQADKARENLLADINHQIQSKSLQQAVNLLQLSLPENIRVEIHRHWVDDLINNTFEQLSNIHIPEGTTEAKIVTPFALTPKQREALNSKIKEKLGFNLDLKEEIEMGVIAGLVVHIGSLELDGSLRSKILEAGHAQQANE